jgi:hypothetical protein
MACLLKIFFLLLCLMRLRLYGNATAEGTTDTWVNMMKWWNDIDREQPNTGRNSVPMPLWEAGDWLFLLQWYITLAIFS